MNGSCHGSSDPSFNFQQQIIMTEINTATSAVVDESPISPARERRDSLEKRLAQRPPVQDLKNRNILLPTNAAPAIQQAQKELERQQAVDSLKKGLEQRPEREALVERNILPESSAAPALQAHQRELEMHMRRDSLESKLQQRPRPEDLVREGILEENEDPTRAA